MAQSSIAAGVQAGSAFGPWGAAIGGAAGMASDAMNAAMGGPFMGGDSKATYGDINTDHSGWTVNVGPGSARTDNAQVKTNTRSEPAPAELANSMGLGGWGSSGYSAAPMQAGGNAVMYLMLGGLALVLIAKKRRK